MRRSLIALLIAVALVLAACSGTDGSDEQQPDDKDNQAVVPTTAPITLTYASAGEFSSYNNNTAEQASPVNAVVLNHVLPGFWSFDADGERVPDTEFGTFEQVTGNPLTVRYTFADGAVWSDGEPIDCDDAVLAWAANVGRWPTGERDQYTGQKLTAFSSFTPAAWSDVSRPECADGDRTFTVTFDRVSADWSVLFGPGTILPAHVLEKETGIKDVIAAVAAGKNATMQKLGRFYNTGWDLRPGKYDAALAPSSGPYQVASWKAGESITLEPNPAWWGAPPTARNLVIDVLPEEDQAQALVDGEVQVIDPTPTEDLLATLEQAGDAVRVEQGDTFVWEHLDFNVDGLFESRALRAAFAKCVPRQAIVDDLIAPLNPDAEVLQSRLRLPFQAGYEQAAAAGQEDYPAVDIEGARAILKREKKLGTRVEIAYLKPDLRRETEVKMIKKSCAKAGFEVVDAGSYTFFSSELKTGDFDAALFAWTSSAQITQPYPIYATDGDQNFIGFHDDDVDLLLDRLYSQLDPDQQLDLISELDAQLWSDIATLPLFVFPSLTASSTQVQGVQHNPSWAGATWNATSWTLASETS